MDECLVLRRSSLKDIDNSENFSKEEGPKRSSSPEEVSQEWKVGPSVGHVRYTRRLIIVS